MDLDEHSYRKLLKRNDVFNEDTCPDMVSVDIWVDNSTGEVDFQSGDVSDVDLQDWLSSYPGKCHGLRLVMPDCNRGRPDRGKMLPLLIKRPAFEAIVESFQLPKAFLQTIRRNEPNRTAAVQVDETGATYHTFILQSCFSTSMDFTLAISYWPSKNKTFAFLCGLSKPERIQLLQQLRPAAGLARYLPLLPAILMDLRADRAQFFIDECHGRLSCVESTTGVFGSTSERRAAIGSRPDWKSLDFDFITQELTSITSELAYSAYSTSDHIATVDFICDAMISCTPQLSQPVTPPILSKLKSLRSFFHGVHEHAAYLAERTKAQVQNVYNLNAQRDNAINIEVAQNSLRLADLTRKDNIMMQELAQASKDIASAAARDSAYMRVISEVTMIFLPATFVATLFSTTFFNLQNNRSGHVVSWWFWLYWLVTLVLTAGVQLYWQLLARRKSRLVVQASQSAPDSSLEASTQSNSVETQSQSRDPGLHPLKELSEKVTLAS